MPARSLPLQRDLCTMKQNRTQEDKVKCQSLLIRIRYMNRLSGNTNWQEYKKSTYYSISRKITSFEYKRIDTLSFFPMLLLDSGRALALAGMTQRCWDMRDTTGLSFWRELLHVCVTNIGQGNLSTNKGYRATFTKAQVGRDLGTEAGQYGSSNRCP